MRGDLLLVDDELAMCDFLGATLAQQGYAVTCRSRAEDALTLLTTRAFDALVTDLRLHGMDGIELCKKARKANPELPIVLFTGYGDMEAAIAALRAGAADFVPKPADPEALIDELRLAVERALDSSRKSDSNAELAEDEPRSRPISDVPSSRSLLEETRQAADGTDDDDLVSLEELERRHIERVLRAVSGNKRAAARMLQVDRSTLYRKLARYKL